MAIRTAQPFNAFMEGRQARQTDDYANTRNAMAQFDLQNAPEEARRRNALLDAQVTGAQQTNTRNAQTFQQGQDLDDKTWGYNVALRLTQARDPNEFGAIADAIVADPRAQKLGIRREMLTPERAQQIVQQAGVSAGVAPAPKMNRVEGPRGSVMQQDSMTGELKQVVGPDNSQPTNPAARAPSGYMFTPEGTLAPIPGGPGDPNAKPKDPTQIRKEFRGLQSVKDYETVLPLIKSAEKAPDTGYGDLQLIYTVGKILDPGSVVREGELALTVAAGSPLERIIGSTRFTASKGGRLTATSRAQLMDMLKERVSTAAQAYQRDYDQYSEYAVQSRLDPSQVVGKPADSAYTQAAQPSQQAPQAAIDYLRANPQFKDAFKQKYGYVPNGL